MLGALNPSHRRVTVVGAGIAGLLIAEALDRAGWEVTCLEAAPRAGGLISTRAAGAGLSESAAHSLLATPAVLGLCARLGVELSPVREKSRFVWRGGKLRKFPLSAPEALFAFLRAYFVPATSRIAPEDMNLEQWGRRFLGEPATRFLLTPFARGIYGARPSQLNASMVFPALAVPRGHSLASWLIRRWHLRLRGRLERASRGRPSHMMAPVAGMGALVAALEARLRERLGERFRPGIAVSGLPRAENLVLCVPAPVAADLLAGEDPRLSGALRGVVYSPLVSVTVFCERSAFGREPRGVGALFPEGTRRKCLGVLFNSSSFPGRVADEGRWISLTAMLGGSAAPELLAASEEEIRALVRGDLEAVFALAPGALLETVIHRQPRAVPQYNAALRSAWDAARAGFCFRPGRVLFGNYTGQVSVRGMIETVESLRGSLT